MYCTVSWNKTQQITACQLPYTWQEDHHCPWLQKSMICSGSSPISSGYFQWHLRASEPWSPVCREHQTVDLWRGCVGGSRRVGSGDTCVVWTEADHTCLGRPPGDTENEETNQSKYITYNWPVTMQLKAHFHSLIHSLILLFCSTKCEICTSRAFRYT